LRRATLVRGALLAGALAAVSHAAPAPGPAAREAPFVVRPFRPFDGPRWIGEAVAYGPHRDGQRPGGASPNAVQTREDLRLMSPHWRLLRNYNSVGPAETLLQVIRTDRSPMKVMLGVWIAPEDVRDYTGRVTSRLPANAAANRAEVEAAVRLAREYPDIVLALCVGNETQISWSAHRLPATLLVGYVREVRARTAQPVTVADDFNFWNKPASREVALEIDFVTTHLHPLWNGKTLEQAVPWIRQNHVEVRKIHPDRLVVIGETGWATRRNDQGDQGKLMKGELGEGPQATFHGALTAWIRTDSIPTFFFEAFDENWKGADDPEEVEKHWGLFRADRTPKQALTRKD
jgi:exo-beta-1,3-glucanase (GH17 family)